MENLKDTLEIISYIAVTVSAVTALIAALVISLQLINIRRAREVDTLLKIIALADDEKTRAARLWVAFRLDNTLTPQQLRSDEDQLEKFSQAVHFFETIGVLVNNKYISERLIFDKYGLLIAGSWGKLKRLIVAFRIEDEAQEYAENFELLISKYDDWAISTSLKVGDGKRLSVKDAKTYFEYKRKTYDHNN